MSDLLSEELWNLVPKCPDLPKRPDETRLKCPVKLNGHMSLGLVPGRSDLVFGGSDFETSVLFCVLLQYICK